MVSLFSSKCDPRLFLSPILLEIFIPHNILLFCIELENRDFLIQCNENFVSIIANIQIRFFFEKAKVISTVFRTIFVCCNFAKTRILAKCGPFSSHHNLYVRVFKISVIFLGMDIFDFSRTFIPDFYCNAIRK